MFKLELHYISCACPSYSTPTATVVYRLTVKTAYLSDKKTHDFLQVLTSPRYQEHYSGMNRSVTVLNILFSQGVADTDRWLKSPNGHDVSKLPIIEVNMS